MILLGHEVAVLVDGVPACGPAYGAFRRGRFAERFVRVPFTGRRGGRGPHDDAGQVRRLAVLHQGMHQAVLFPYKVESPGDAMLKRRISLEEAFRRIFAKVCLRNAAIASNAAWSFESALRSQFVTFRCVADANSGCVRNCVSSGIFQYNTLTCTEKFNRLPQALLLSHSLTRKRRCKMHTESMPHTESMSHNESTSRPLPCGTPAIHSAEIRPKAVGGNVFSRRFARFAGYALAVLAFLFFVSTAEASSGRFIQQQVGDGKAASVSGEDAHDGVSQTARIAGRVPCVDGEAAGYPCKDMDLLAFVPIEEMEGFPCPSYRPVLQ